MSRFLFFIYRKLLDLLFLLAYPFLLLFLPKDEKHERLGWHIPIIRNCIWVHAASVGEVNASKNLILEMLEQYPDKEIILTTTSLTGRKTARTISERLHVHLLPLDIPLVMNHFIMSIRPDIVILIETEIWPVMLYRLKRMKVPVIWVNARISDRSY
ncbi:MAG TPA: glycosyltransferase N-terminal domain-containing protein, partial [Candidatus Cloacimonadota bacterium]|nr:glycosyltransferase N-terminal domain-containing protein [Candidatus Cloacimonadota bacterium]